MRTALDELNVEDRADHAVTLEVRVGIDTGDVVVSTLGDRPGQEFVVVGDIVNRPAGSRAGRRGEASSSPPTPPTATSAARSRSS